MAKFMIEVDIPNGRSVAEAEMAVKRAFDPDWVSEWWHIDDVASQAALLQQLAYSREFEALADRRSAEIMVAAKRDPLAFVELLQRLNPKAENEAEDGWFSTHPTSGNRMLVVRDHVRALKNP